LFANGRGSPTSMGIRLTELTELTELEGMANVMRERSDRKRSMVASTDPRGRHRPSRIFQCRGSSTRPGNASLTEALGREPHEPAMGQ
jgi:hypothetical protein